MDSASILQHLVNGAMLGMMYALVAVGFTLFFGVLDVIKFSHGDVLMLGAFTALSAALGLSAAGIEQPLLQLALMLVAGIALTGLVGALVGRYLVLPLKSAPALNTLLITLMFGTALREAVRVFYPQGSNPKPFPRLLPDDALQLGALSLRADSLLLLALGALVIIATHWLIGRTKLGLAIRAVAQDEETAKIMGINYTKIVLITFALGSALAALAGIINGLYYNEINFSMGLNLGVIGFAAAIVGGLGNFYGAIIGGFLFAALQTIGAVAIPFGSSYKDVFAFAVVIALMAWKPTGLIAEQEAQRV